MTPSRSQLDGYDAAPLLAIAAGLRDFCGQSESVFDRYVKSVVSAHGETWQGKTADAVQSRAHADRRTVRHMVDLLESAASSMEQGYYEIVAPLNRVKIAILEAENQGHRVTEFLEVMPRRADTTAIAVAEEWRQTIVAAANEVAAADQALRATLAGTSSEMTLEFKAVAASVMSPDEHRFRDVRHWMYGEMMKNIRSEIVDRIKSLNGGTNTNTEWWAFLRDRDQENRSRIAAFAGWLRQVRPGGSWDHKEFLRNNFPDSDYFYQQPGTNRQIYYDIWSNIHYGFVGRAAGFDTDTLLRIPNEVPAVAGRTARADDIATELGASLYDQYGPDMTEEQFSAAVSSMIDKMSREKNAGTELPQLNYGGT